MSVSDHLAVVATVTPDPDGRSAVFVTQRIRGGNPVGAFSVALENRATEHPGRRVANRRQMSSA